MPGVVALIIAVIVFWLVLKAVFLIGAVLISLAVAVAVFALATKLFKNKAP
jgi:multisubunit Na+/H+ antiporter MnhE subunit